MQRWIPVTSRAVALSVAAEAPPQTGWGEAALRLLGGSSADVLPGDAAVDWDDLNRRYGRRVIIALLARGVAPERAKELAQDAWMRVIQSHRAGRLPELRLPGVVIAQATFFALDDRRRTERQRSRAAMLEGEAQPDARGLEQRVWARAQLRLVQGVIERSHPNAQRVFHLLYGSRGLAAAEIAEELGLSTQRVRQIACELRGRIRRELDGGTP